MYAITYAVKLTQLSMLVKINGAHQRINFGGSVDKGSAIFTTSDPAVMEAIEATQKYKDGFIFFYKDYGKRPEAVVAPVVDEVKDIVVDEVKDIVVDEVKDIVVDEVKDIVADEVKDIVADEVKDIVADEVKDIVAETPVVDEVKEAPGKKVYPDTIKTVQGAGRALQADFGVKAKEVETKAKVLAKAAELNVEFPGLAD